MLNIITINEKDKWLECLTKCSDYDFYHTHEYHLISQKNGEGDPILFSYEIEDLIICLPVLRKEIRDNLGNLHGYDFTSVYGYAGPIYSKGITKDFIVSFQNHFKEYCQTNDIVTMFSRLHPTILQNFILKNLGEIHQGSRTIQIDLTQTLEKQRKHYRKSNKSEINKLRKETSIVWSDNSKEDIDEFIDIYEETMHRVNARKKYFFPEVYYKGLFSSTDFKTKLLFIEFQGTKIGAAIFIFCNNMIQYHLAGTRTEFMKLTPMKLLIDEVRIFGTSNGYKSFHLGGGVTNSEQDSLFKFKRGFSKIECDFSMFQYVINRNKYNELIDILTPNRSNIDASFFPIYRG